MPFWGLYTDSSTQDLLVGKKKKVVQKCRQRRKGVIGTSEANPDILSQSLVITHQALFSYA